MRRNSVRTCDTAPGGYYENSFGDIFAVTDDDVPGVYDAISLDERLTELLKYARRLGFMSLFDSALADARRGKLGNSQTRSQMRTFTGGGCFTELVTLFNECAISKINPWRQLDTLSPAECVSLTLPIYREEWKTLRTLPQLNRPFNRWTPDYISMFSFVEIYHQMKKAAPHLFQTIECLTTPSRSKTNERDRKDGVDTDSQGAHRKERYLVLVFSILAHLQNNHTNYLQGVFGVFLYAFKVPKRVIMCLNHIGVCVSYTAITAFIKTGGERLSWQLRQLGTNGTAISPVVDNLNIAINVRDPRIFNEGTFLSWICGLVVEPPASRAHKRFTDADVHLDLVTTLNLNDFLIRPGSEEEIIMKASASAHIADVLYGFARHLQVKLQELKFPMPVVFAIDPKEKSKVYSLRTYDFDEAKPTELIEALYEIQKDIGLPCDGAENYTILYHGDFLTVRNLRYILNTLWITLIRICQFQQGDASTGMQFRYLETATGVFHLDVASLGLTFTTHFGKVSDVSSLSHWMKFLRKDMNQMWNPQQALVKDFDRCLDFFNTVLDGTILASVAAYHFPSERTIDTFARSLPSIPVDLLAKSIEEISDTLLNQTLVSRMRRGPPASRDPVHENIILFLQHGIIVRNFSHAISSGDTGRLVNSFTYLTLWFQSSDKKNYAGETMHLTACLKKLWSNDLRKYWMENCVINLTRKKDGFIALDMLNEYVVREVKKMMHPSLTPATSTFIRDYLSLMVFTFREVRVKMAAEFEATILDFNSPKVDRWVEVKAVASELLKTEACTFCPGREVPEESTVVDLMINGYISVADGKKIGDYIDKVEESAAALRDAAGADEIEGGITGEQDEQAETDEEENLTDSDSDLESSGDDTEIEMRDIRIESMEDDYGSWP